MARSLTKAEKAKKKKADMKALFNKTKNEQLRKGQKGMTLKQRQADDQTVARKKLIAKNSKSDADYEKKVKRMKKSVSQQTGTSSKNIDKLKAGPGAAAGRVEGAAKGAVNYVKDKFTFKNGGDNKGLSSLWNTKKKK